MKRIIAIGGGEIKSKTTLKIDEYIANLAKLHAEPYNRRANILFMGTASYDSFPYFNSVRKTYTSVFDIKTEIALLVQRPQEKESIIEKIENADAIYVGGGNTAFLIKKWKESGIFEHIVLAYEKGVPIAGLSAGAICWFERLYSDFEIQEKLSEDFALMDGFSLLKGMITPHYNQRREFDKVFLESGAKTAYAIEDNAAIEFVDGEFSKVLSSGGKAFLLSNQDGNLVKTEL